MYPYSPSGHSGIHHNPSKVLVQFKSLYRNIPCHILRTLLYLQLLVLNLTASDKQRKVIHTVQSLIQGYPRFPVDRSPLVVYEVLS